MVNFILYEFHLNKKRKRKKTQAVTLIDHSLLTPAFPNAWVSSISYLCEISSSLMSFWLLVTMFWNSRKSFYGHNATWLPRTDKKCNTKIFSEDFASHFSICDLKREIKLVATGLNKKYLLSYLYMYMYTCVCINAFLKNSVPDP